MLQRLAASLRRHPPLTAAVRCVSSGSVDITVPLNFWAGKRRTSREKCSKENVYEPATGKWHNSMILKKDVCLLTLFLNWTLVTAVWACLSGGLWPEKSIAGILTDYLSGSFSAVYIMHGLHLTSTYQRSSNCAHTLCSSATDSFTMLMHHSQRATSMCNPFNGPWTWYSFLVTLWVVDFSVLLICRLFVAWFRVWTKISYLYLS